MDAFLGLLASYGAWGIIAGMIFYDRWQFRRGDVVPARTLERSDEKFDKLLTAIEGLGQVVSKNTDATLGIQATVRDQQATTEGVQDAVEKLQTTLDEFRHITQGPK